MSSVQPEPEDADLGAAVRDFLADHDSFIRWQLGSEKIPVTRHAVFFGQGDHRLEVALASSATGRPKVEAVRQLWQERHGGRASPVLLVVLYLERGRVRATVCGPVGTAPTVETGHDRSSVERLCGAALAEPSDTPRSASSSACWTGCAPS